MSKNNNKLAIIAPGHHIFDERVLRTVEEFSKDGHIFVICDVSKDKILKLDKKLQERVTYIQFPLPHITGFRARIRKIKELLKIIEKFDLRQFYIHESGTFGIQIANIVQKKGRTYFDYHDWIPFEIKEKFSNYYLYSLVYFFVRLYIRKVIKKINLVIFISNAARDYFSKNYLIVNSHVVPNARKTIIDIGPPKKYDNSHKNDIEILWIGNVMRLRQIEKIFDLAKCLNNKQPSKKIAISIWGKIKERQYAEELMERKKDLGKQISLDFFGEFNSEKEIKIGPSKMTIGIAFGWNEKWSTGMNEISRPTKVASYGVCGIPALIDSKCTSLIAELENYDADIPFCSSEDACEKVLWLFNNPTIYNSKADNLRNYSHHLYNISKESVSYLHTLISKN